MGSVSGYNIDIATPRHSDNVGICHVQLDIGVTNIITFLIIFINKVAVLSASFLADLIT